jgi:hypothetical protein
MNYFIYSIISIILSIACVVILYFISKNQVYSDVKTHQKCKDVISETNDLCGAWNNKKCYKGHVSKNANGDKICKKKGSIIGYILLNLLGILFICSIIFMILGFMNKNKSASVSAFSYNFSGDDSSL